jgi:hypothetical protein
MAGCLSLALLILTLLLSRSAAAAGPPACSRAGENCGSSVLDRTMSNVTTTSRVGQHDTTEASPVITQRPVEPDSAAARLEFGTKPETSWYRTTLGVAGIGIAVAVATMPMDRNINRFDIRHSAE